MTFIPFIAIFFFAMIVRMYMQEAAAEEYRKDIQAASDDNWSCGSFDDWGEPMTFPILIIAVLIYIYFCLR